MIDTTIIDVANAPELSDEELYTAFLESEDREIIGALFRKYMALTFGVCMKYLSEKHAAQDATMEIFERLIQYRPANAIQNFRAYLYVMSKNHCLMKQRGEKPQWVEISESDMESAMEVHPLDEMHEEKQSAALEKCLKTLKELQKDCVQLFYLKKKSYMQISQELKVTLSAVKSHIQNGKRNLKTCIEGTT